jgi:hypothetical protein
MQHLCEGGGTRGRLSRHCNTGALPGSEDSDYPPGRTLDADACICRQHAAAPRV